jgi:CDP-diacylglycerol---serine O-phosphatidyltransferase
MKSKYRYIVPNGITFISLTCGILSMMLAATYQLEVAGILILVSYILDLLDGATARRLQASSAFGLQLDSLVDMVSLGTAPAILVFMHLQAAGLTSFWVWLFVVLVPLAGAFRLARFNLLPPKEDGERDSMGLTITSAGATLALAVLADLSIRAEYLPDWLFVFLMGLLCVLMVSKIPFPSFFWVFASIKRSTILVTLFILSVLITTFFNAWFFWQNVYLGFSLLRAGYKTWK